MALLGVSATLTKKTHAQILEKAEFLSDYQLMQTSLDRPETMQIYHFMEHLILSYLDLQFILPDAWPETETAIQANDIQKTIVFVNCVTQIRPMIRIIQNWMIIKGYPAKSSLWIRLYHSTILDYTKALTLAAFAIPGDDNNQCTILVATDAYGIKIDNLDVRLVIQWDVPLSFDTLIQRIGRVGKIGVLSTFVLFLPTWMQIDNQVKIERQFLTALNGTKTAASLLLDSNQPRALKPNPLSQVVDATKDVLDSELVAKSEAEFDFDSDVDFPSLLATDADENQLDAKQKFLASRTNAEKRAKLLNKIF